MHPPVALINLFFFCWQLFIPWFNPVNFITPAITLAYRNGQTFITWDERTDLQGEKYRLYRSSHPITASNLGQATLLGEVGKDSARFYANRYKDRSTLVWYDRFVDRYVIQNFGSQMPVGKGLLVWTLEPQDFGGAASGNGYYAVTVTPAGGVESFDPAGTAGPVAEAVADPLPVEINSATNMQFDAGAHVFIQYMDLRNWNPTFHAPNPSNEYYGVDPNAPGVADDLQYAYDYLVYVSTAAMCGGKLPSKLPVIINLHGHRANTYFAKLVNPDLFCAYVILPQDETDTWYFGFARLHDYRKGGEVGAGDIIVNYTEQRVLRMLYDLERKPIGPEVDKERVYVEGQSMGASGALAFAERYPNVFAAAYACQPMTDYQTAGFTAQTDWLADVTVKWGAPQLNLPIKIDAPNGWADPLQKYNGIGVWDWQNYLASTSAAGILSQRLYDSNAPLGINLSAADQVISWPTQGVPTFPAFNAGDRTWGAIVSSDIHEWQYYRGLPPDLAPLPFNLNNFRNWVPYWNLSVIRDETVPGLSNLSGNSTAAPGGYYNQTILWSSSWYPWDDAPIDQPSLWRISLCSVSVGSLLCGSGQAQTVDVTLRRVQAFVIKPGMRYSWRNQRISDGAIVAAGTITADMGGMILIPGFQVSTEGNRLIVKPAPIVKLANPY